MQIKQRTIHQIKSAKLNWFFQISKIRTFEYEFIFHSLMRTNPVSSCVPTAWICESSFYCILTSISITFLGPSSDELLLKHSVHVLWYVANRRYPLVQVNYKFMAMFLVWLFLFCFVEKWWWLARMKHEYCLGEHPNHQLPTQGRSWYPLTDWNFVVIKYILHAYTH